MQLRHLARQPAFLPAMAAVAVLIVIVWMISPQTSTTLNPHRPAAQAMPAGAGTLESIAPRGDRGFVLTINRGAGQRVRLLADARTRVVVPAGASNVVGTTEDLRVGQRVDFQIAPGRRIENNAHLGRVTVIERDGESLSPRETIA